MKKLSARQYAVAIDQVLADVRRPQLQPVAERVLRRLRRNRSLKLWPRIAEYLRDLEAARAGQLRALIEAPSQEIATAVAKKLRKIRAEMVVDPALGHGVAVTVNDQRIDLTLRGRLNQLRHSLLSE